MLFTLVLLSMSSVIHAATIAVPTSPQVPSFEANPSIDVAGILAVLKATATTAKPVAAYPPEPGSSKKVQVYENLVDPANPKSSMYHFIADMDVDCDGVGFKCAGNSDGNSETSFGHLSASDVPYMVLPMSMTGTISPNALGAVICNDRLFYAIYGDQNGASPEVIGEASIMLAKTCFPNDNISGNSGHDKVDVAYMVFASQVPPGVQDQTIDIETLKALGDEQMKLFQNGLSLNPPSTSTATSHSSAFTGGLRKQPAPNA
ncbi:fungal chitosanase of glycosyl hydrolase group 75-domain-containing protein [Mycena floridula]|nr:fungal chitosanase of glycosyl hydrolase group 75-domain-containing protein [Mycena floridula]